MKKEIFSIQEKHERITIRYRRKRLIKICNKCGKEFESLTVEEAADLIGKDAEYVRQNLKLLRSKNK